MATIKLKFRPSTVQGKAGTLCYQLCHRQENRQIEIKTTIKKAAESAKKEKN